MKTEVPKFNRFATYGDTVKWTNGPFDMTATLVPDSDASPDDDEGTSPAARAAWLKDKWFYVGVVVSASLEGVVLGDASLWGVDCNHPESECGNDYLSDVAAELEDEAVSEARAKLDKMAERLANDALSVA